METSANASRTPAPDDVRDRLQTLLSAPHTFERELTGGGMSRVFLAVETALGRRVVVKVLPPELAGGVNAERFRREIRLCASLQQANVVPVLAAGEVDGLPYYTMPFVEGESLRARLTARGAIPPREAVGMLRDIARALSFAHERGVVHRDIKPENVLLSGSTAVVTDFGIAKALAASHTNPSSATLTQLGSTLGTPAYAAPEQVSGDAIDHRADIYALGVVAYELLTGAPPFVAQTAQALFAAHIAQQPEPISQRRKGLPSELATLVMRCLEKDPARRPQSATEVLEVLEAAMTPAEAARATSRAKPSIAVLPFANLSPDPNDEYFADGLTDEIITDLAPIRTLHVIARASMMRFKGSEKDPLTVARDLAVRYVLDGSVRRAGSSLRLTARLIDSVDGTTLWSEKLGGVVEDIFAMQERVSRTIVDALKLTLSPREDEQLRARPISDLRAYECYLQARQSMWTFTVPSLDRALQLLNDAQSLVADNARLVAALGFVHMNYVETGQVDPVRHLQEADACLAKLSALEPDSFHIAFLRGWLHWRRGEIREALSRLTRARDLEPNSSDVECLLCYAYILAGQDDRAREAADAGVRLDPLTPLFQCMPGFCDMMGGRPDTAIAHYRRFFEMDPGNPAAHMFLTWSLAEAGQRTEALTIANGLAQRFPGTVFGELGAAFACGLRGERQEGLAILGAQLRSLSRHSEMLARFIATTAAELGDADGAIDALQDCVRLGFCHYPYLERRATILRTLRVHPRFQEILEVVRARWERGGTSATDLSQRTESGDRNAGPSVAALQ